LKVDLFDFNKFIEVNSVQEVKNPITFEKGNNPTEDGLLSYTIFGLPGSYDRKTIFGYIDLKKRFVHPLVYKMLLRMNKKFRKVIDGSSAFVITNGELVEDNENGKTGITWLYENFDKLKFKENDSFSRNNRVALLNNVPKNELFIDKYLVIPAFYRDMELKNGRINSDKINNMYTALISLTLSNNNEFEFMGYLTESKIQDQLVELYEYLIHYLEKKQGLIKNGLLGKTVDYSVRSVISAGRVNSNSPEDQLVKFSYTGIPLPHLCNLFFPFFVYEIQSWAEEVFSTVIEFKAIDNRKNKKKKSDSKSKLNSSLDFLPLSNIDGNESNIRSISGDIRNLIFVNPMEAFTSTKIENMLNLFINSPESRLDPIKLNAKIIETGEIVTTELHIYFDELRRRFTLLDLIFIIAHRVCENKHVYVTRFPVENHQSIFPTRIKILSTYETTTVTIANKYFKNYPLISIDKEYPDRFNKAGIHYVDTIIPHNSTLQSLGADFDGKN